MLPYWKKNTKKRKADDGQPKKRTKRKPDLVKKLDRVFSLYIRLRDAMPSGFVRCISCGKIKRFEDVDCGHYFSRTHMATRFDEDNCNAECRSCNRMSADHLIGYRKNLVAKIGLNRIDRLDVLAHSQKHWLDSELEEKIRYYTAEVRRLSQEKGIHVNL
jgi:hypothetical protein